MTESRENVRRKQFRERAQAPLVDPPAGVKQGQYLAYNCPTCGRKRQTTAADIPDMCPTCILDHRAKASR